jgi:phosphosulfolactate synthase (CoM biosynthesis protein A)
VKRFVCGAIFIAKIAEGNIRELDFHRVSEVLLFELLEVSNAFVELASDSSLLLANLS